MKILPLEHSLASQVSMADLQRVLIMQLDDSSAVVMLSPALRTLRESLPEAKLTLLTSAAGSEIASLLPWVDNVMADRTIGQDESGSRSINPRDEIAFVERLRRHNFSLALIYTSVSQSSSRAAYACYLAGIPYRVGFANEKSSAVLSHFLLPPPDEVHQVDRNLDLLKAIGVSGADPRMELHVPAEVENSASELLGSCGVKPEIPYIVFAPGSTGMLSRYDSHNFAAVAHILSAQTEQQLLVVGSAAEAKSIEPVLEVADKNLYGNMYSLVEKTTLPELAAIISHASLTIANPSLSMHLADVFGCPMVILHTETARVSQWVPRNAAVRLLSRPANCSHCTEEECPHGINCLDVRPEEVAIAALELLAEQTYNQADFREILGYRIESEANEESSPHWHS